MLSLQLPWRELPNCIGTHLGFPGGWGTGKLNGMNEPALIQQRTPTHTHQGMGCGGLRRSGRRGQNLGWTELPSLPRRSSQLSESASECPLWLTPGRWLLPSLGLGQESGSDTGKAWSPGRVWPPRD